MDPRQRAPGSWAEMWQLFFHWQVGPFQLQYLVPQTLQEAILDLVNCILLEVKLTRHSWHRIPDNDVGVEYRKRLRFCLWVSLYAPQRFFHETLHPSLLERLAAVRRRSDRIVRKRSV